VKKRVQHDTIDIYLYVCRNEKEVGMKEPNEITGRLAFTEKIAYCSLL
jgi:hypothetical protein